MLLPLVVGVDGSDSSLLAVDWAVGEAARYGLPLRLVNASRWERYEGTALDVHTLGRPTRHAPADTVVGVAAERAHRRNPDVAVSVDVLAEDAVTALLDAGRNASALITGSRGRGGIRGLLLGSVGLAVAARAHCPVIVVRGDKAGLEGTHQRILLGVAEPPKGSAAVRFAFREAEARGCTLDAVRAWRSPAHEPVDHPLIVGGPEHYLEEQAASLIEEALGEAVRERPEVVVRRDTVEGPAHKVLVERSAAADMIIVGAARRRHGHLGLQLGRVAHAALHHAYCPVAVVPQSS